MDSERRFFNVNPKTIGKVIQRVEGKDNKLFYEKFGGNSDRIGNIVGKIIETRVENGEHLDQKDIAEIQTQVESSYNRIVEAAERAGMRFGINSQNVITKSLTYLENYRGDISDIKGAVDSQCLKAINDEIIETKGPEQTEKSTSPLAGIVSVAVGAIANQIEHVIVENLLTKETRENINNEYQAAAKGDINAVSTIFEIEKLTSLASKNPVTLDEKTTRGVLARMMRMAGTENKTAESVLLQMAERYGMNDLILTGSDGSKSFNAMQLQRNYQSAVSKVNPKAATKTLQDFRMLSLKSAQKQLESGEYSKPGLTIEQRNRDDIENDKLTQFEKRVSLAYRNNDLDQVSALVATNPEYGQAMARDLTKWSQNPRLSPDKATSLSAQISCINGIINKKSKVQDSQVESMEIV